MGKKRSREEAQKEVIQNDPTVDKMDEDSDSSDSDEVSYETPTEEPLQHLLETPSRTE